MAAISTIITVALTAYSAVSAIKALKEGNILGAVVAGFGAYMGMSALGNFGTAVAGDATALAASQGGQLAGQTSVFGAEGASMTAEALGSVGSSGIGATSSVMGDYALQSANIASAAASAAPSLELSKPLEGSAAPTQTTGVMNSLKSIGNNLADGWSEAIADLGATVNKVGDLIAPDGSLLAKAGEAVGGSYNLMGLAKEGLGYLGQQKIANDQIEAGEDAEKRLLAEAQRKRDSRGAAPTYQYSFGQDTRNIA